MQWMNMGNKGYANQAKSGQKALPTKLKRVKRRAETRVAKTQRGKRKRPSE